MSGIFAGVYNSSDENLELLTKSLKERFDCSLTTETYEDVFFVSSEHLWQDCDYIILFDGHILNENEDLKEHLNKKVREDSFPKNINGRFRGAVYNKKKDRIVFFTDKTGGRKVYYSAKSDRLGFSTHLSPLTTLSWIQNELNPQAVKNLLINPWSSSGGPTLMKDVERLYPAQKVCFSEHSIRKDIYWDVEPGVDLNISDKMASKVSTDLLREAAERINKNSEGDITIQFSGGLDSSLIAALLKETSADPDNIKTLTYGWKKRHFEENFSSAEKISSHLDLRHEKKMLESRLPTQEEVWTYEEPTAFSGIMPVHQIHDGDTTENMIHGHNSIYPFPETIASKKAERWSGIDRLFQLIPLGNEINQLQTLLPRKKMHGTLHNIAAGVSVLSSPNNSSLVVNERAPIDPHRKEICEFDYYKEKMRWERELDLIWDTSNMSYSEAFSYLHFRQIRPYFYVDLYSNFCDLGISEYDLFGYAPLLNFSYKLPMKQRNNRRLEELIMSENFPDLYHTTTPSGFKIMRDIILSNIEADYDTYREQISLLGERELVNKEGVEKHLLTGDSFDRDFWRPWNVYAVTGISCYLLELWIKTFIERDKPWKRPD